jgi:hypothetical protein
MKAIKLAGGVGLIVCLASCEHDEGQWRRFSVVPQTSERQRSEFRNTGELVLTRILTIGSLEGPQEYTFSGITDVELGPDGSVYVIDPNAHQVSVYDSTGSYRRAIGRAGAGPGEFVAPTEVAIIGDSLAVFDQSLLRVSVFSTEGKYARAFPLQLKLETLSADPSGGLAITHSSRTSTLARVRLDGRALPTARLAAEADSLLPPNQLQNPGVACAAPRSDALFYANSWIEEIVALDSRGAVQWAKYWPNEVLTSRPSGAGQIDLDSPKGLVIGLACSEAHAILAYLDRGTRTIFFDILTTRGEPIERLSFRASDSTAYPGIIGSMSGNRLVTARNRPFPQVFVFRIAGLPFSE